MLLMLTFMRSCWWPRFCFQLSVSVEFTASSKANQHKGITVTLMGENETADWLFWFFIFERQTNQHKCVWYTEGLVLESTTWITVPKPSWSCRCFSINLNRYLCFIVLWEIREHNHSDRSVITKCCLKHNSHFTVNLLYLLRHKDLLKR